MLTARGRDLVINNHLLSQLILLKLFLKLRKLIQEVIFPGDICVLARLRVRLSLPSSLSEGVRIFG